MTSTWKPCAAVLLLCAVGGCVGPPVAGTPSPAAPSAPTRALVVWVDAQCTSQTSLASLQRRAAQEVAEISSPQGGFGRTPEQQASTFVFSTSAQLDSVASDLPDAPASGIAAADELRAEFVAAVQAVAPEIETLDREAFSGTPEETIAAAQRVGELVASIDAPDLAELLGTEPELAQAYDLAPRCTPLAPSAAPTTTPTTSGPPPTAADGTDVSSCADGTCQILVSGPVDVQVGDSLLQISRRPSGDVIVGRPGERGSYTEFDLGSGGSGSFGSVGGPTITVTVDGVGPDGAVLSISTEG